MKKFITKSLLSVSLLTLSAGGLIPAYAQEGMKSDYRNIYQTDPTSLDYLFTYRNPNTMHTINFIEGLYENDQYGNYIPALAESHEVSEDGLVYTYHLRKGVKWVDMNGNEWGETTAHDFVTGLQHAADVQSEMLPIVQDTIQGLDEYIKGEATDFSQVGVKAIDDYTLQYTLTRPEPYFNSKTNYGILYPVNQAFLESKGDEFGALSPDAILYNGPYRLVNLTAKSVIEYAKNESYWDKDNVHLNTVTFSYNDGSDTESYYRLFKDKAMDSMPVNPTAPIYQEILKENANAVTLQPAKGSTNLLHFNLNRVSRDASQKKSDPEFESTKKAILNKKFRQALMFGFNRAAYMQQTHGEEFRDKAIRNMLVPDNFVNVNGESFGKAVSKYLAEINPELYSDVDLGEGHDAFYNPEKAKKLMAEARKELEGQGVQFPIHMDLLVLDQDSRRVNLAQSLKVSMEEAVGTDNLVVDLNLLNQDSYLAMTFNATIAEDIGYDISNENAWGPDYQDPSTYLDIYDPEKGAMLTVVGLNATFEGEEDPAKSVREQTELFDYQAKLNDASAITDNMDARYDAYAKAQAQLIDMAIALPIRNQGSNVRLTRVVPYSGPYSLSGNGGDKLKFTRVQEEAVTKEQFEAALQEWKQHVSGQVQASSAELLSSESFQADQSQDEN